MSKHTPGPWEVSYKFGRSGLIGPVRTTNDYPVASVTGYYEVAGQTEPNARLIAAAPELLEALEKLLGLYDLATHDEYDGTDLLVGLLADADFARAAIAKAKGETP